MENRSEIQAHTLTFKFLGNEKDIQLFAKDKIENCKDPVRPKFTEPCDPRYAPYVDVYNNLDNLLWQVPAFLAAISALGFGLLGNFISDPQTAMPPFTHNVTVGIFFLLWGFFYFLGAYAMWRIRIHHTLMGNELAKLESDGYFKKRSSTVVKKLPPSAPHLFIFTFSILAFLIIILGIYNILHP